MHKHGQVAHNITCSSVVGMGLEGGKIGNCLKFSKKNNFSRSTYHTGSRNGLNCLESLKLDEHRPDSFGRGFPLNWSENWIQVENLSQMFMSCAHPVFMFPEKGSHFYNQCGKCDLKSWFYYKKVIVDFWVPPLLVVLIPIFCWS